MPISFDRNVLTDSFEQMVFLEPDFEFGEGGHLALHCGLKLGGVSQCLCLCISFLRV